MPDIPSRRIALLVAGTAAAFVLGADLRSAEAGEGAPERDLAERYIEAWRAKDLDALRRTLDPNLTFSSPTASTTGVEPYLDAARRFFPLYDGIAVRALLAAPGLAMLVYDVDCAPPIGRCPTAELLTLSRRAVVASEVFFDPRPFVALRRPAAKP